MHLAKALPSYTAKKIAGKGRFADTRQSSKRKNPKKIAKFF
jgi:hypothetical protein